MIINNFQVHNVNPFVTSNKKSATSFFFISFPVKIKFRSLRADWFTERPLRKPNGSQNKWFCYYDYNIG